MSDDIDPFAEATPEEKAAEEEAKKNVQKKEKKEAVGKSTLVLQISPADTEVNLDDLENKIRTEIKEEGLLWGKSERKPLYFGLVAILLGAVVTDDVSVDGIQEKIESWDDLVASTEIIAFQKI
ncbi:putative elongation factor 1 beta [Histomonas meleagridis]|uniref:putative elongation factor 1 beta n=1 Tax=Histomonas meleagridis TaxID=135588 RepID=UPI003559E1A6|nr:putative elongation factor 1 beta [Histomonas meleagridis]KAH0791092.1 putative elongation factor 1 beta [Histomonas meleagridis]KAH0800312.1 putative elongation factor 1 beta [Histomonas meleagridis]KAH0802439.1 putative elongation factor 1 beta [Histomonas meleagridis]